MLVFAVGSLGIAVPVMFQGNATWGLFFVCAALTGAGFVGAFIWKIWWLRPDLAQAPLNQHRFIRSAENRLWLFALIYCLVAFGLGSAARLSSLPYASEIVTAFGILGYILIPWLGIPRTIAKWEKK